jgi:aldehyde:ferredoxin oxidoreductase
MDTRDPMGGGHGYTTNFTHFVQRIGLGDEQEWENVRQLSAIVYGAPGAADPRCGYEGKAHAASFHCDRNALKDALGICDGLFPWLVDLHAEDLLPRVDRVIGPSLEHYISEPVLGGISEEPFDRTSTRIFTLERALQIRNWGRDRATDETIIPYLGYPEARPNPLLGERMRVFPDRFRVLMDEFYDLRGWDQRTGWPMYDTLKQLGMRDIADGMARSGKLPDRDGTERWEDA